MATETDQTWDRVRELMVRDQQTAERELHLDDTAYEGQLRQATHDAAAQDLNRAPQAEATAHEIFVPSAVEVPLRFGIDAREHFQSVYPRWNNDLENELRTQWSQAEPDQPWETVRDRIRRGYEHGDSAPAGTP